MARSPAPLAIQIENFRSIRSTTLTIRPGVNILIGPNGAGKTCLLAALKFVRDLLSEGVGMAMAKGGGPRRNYNRGQNVIRFSLEHSLGVRVFRRKRSEITMRWSVSISQAGPEAISTIAEESLCIFLDKDPAVVVCSVQFDRAEKAQSRAVVDIAPERSFGVNTLSPALGAEKTRRGRYQIVERLCDQARDENNKSADRSVFPLLAMMDSEIASLFNRLVNLNEYNILPDVARQATDQLPYAEVSPNGSGLSEVIDALRKGSFRRLRTSRDQSTHPWFFMDRAAYRYMPLSLHYQHRESLLKQSTLPVILEKITKELSLAVHSITGLSTAIDPTNGKRFVLFEAGEQRFVPEEISDGTIKWLAILVTIFVPFSAVYVLEEPENFLHPWMQQQLIRTMRDQAAEQGTYFLITTHSATVLNAAQPDEIAVVSLSDLGTHTERLADRASINKVLAAAEFGLGDLWVSGVLGGVPGGSE